jgi:hypothetical protein
MRIAYVSLTHHAGVPERMAIAVNQYTGHEARALVPGPWLAGKSMFRPGRTPDHLWDVRDVAQRDECLEWADVIHAIYNCSLDKLGRPDLGGRKLFVWHLATRWHPVFMTLFPTTRPNRLVVSAEGWTRYGLPSLAGSEAWGILPNVFLLDDPLYQPCPFGRRVRYASMSPRVGVDENASGEPIAAPRMVPSVKEQLKGLAFHTYRSLEFEDCMRRKRRTWIGIDDVVNPLVHQSGFEYLAMGVPCVNLSDRHLKEEVARATGAVGWPFFEADMAHLRPVVAKALAAGGEWQVLGADMRRWMERAMHPRDVIGRYVDLYDRAEVPA